MSGYGLAPNEIEQKHALDIKRISTFRTYGVSEKEAIDYLRSPEGRIFWQILIDADRNASLDTISDRAIGLIKSGRELPQMEFVNEALVKISPADTPASPTSAYFTKQAELMNEAALGHDLNQRFGLPVKSEASVYTANEIRPRNGPTLVFVSEVAPTSELHGQVTRSGGAKQYLVLNRSQFTEATPVMHIGNNLLAHEELLVGKGLGVPIAMKATAVRGLHGATLAKGLGAVGVAATAYDALSTASRAHDLHEQGSLLASQSQLTHFAARNVGGWAGAAAGVAIGWETGPGVVAFAAVGAISTSAAGEKIADWWDQQKIYRQTDRDGVDWKFNGRQWLRQQQADLVNDGVDAPQRQAFAALPGKANELNYRATLAAVDLAAGEAPEPKDPYRLPTNESDRPSLRTADWRHDPVTGEWHRNVATALNPHNDRPIYKPETASPQRAAQLDQQAATIIAENIANGPAARAARVDQAYRANNWQEFGPLPENLRAALSNPDTLTASDGKRYQRGADGNWSHDGHIAEGNRKLELEATRAALQPALAQHAEAMAAVHARAPLSPQEQERANLATTYASFGIKPNADTMEAALLAAQRTRESHGIDATTTSLAPQPNAKGGYSAESALGHLHTDANGVVRMAAVTSSEDIRNALDEIRLQRIEGRDIQNPAPVTTIGSRSAGGRESQLTDDSPVPTRRAQVLADNPAHPDFDTFNRIHTWVRGTGQWDEEKSRNVASALYREQAGDPLVKRVDRVLGGVGRDGAENVFAVYAPFGDKEPFFHANVDGRGASQLPAQQSLEQAEQTKLQHVQHQQQEQTMQQDRQAQRGAQLSM